MHRPHLLTSILATLIVAACGAADPSTADPVAARQEAIQGGYVDTNDTAVIRTFYREGGTAACSASLIAPNVLLFAKHCVPPSLQGGCSSGAASNAGELLITIATVHNGQDYVAAGREVRYPADGCSRDVTALILDKTLAIAPVAPRLDTPATPGEIYAAVGYGMENATGPFGTTRRRIDGLSVQCTGTSACNGVAYSDADEWAGAGSACSGDSGGPALDAKGRVIGIAERTHFDGNICAGPTVYGRIDVMKDFITQTVLDGAKMGGYALPAWMGSPSSEPQASGGSAGSSGSSGGTSQASGGANPRGQPTSTTSPFVTPPAAPPEGAGHDSTGGGTESTSASDGEPAGSSSCALSSLAPSAGASVWFLATVLALVARRPVRARWLGQRSRSPLVPTPRALRR